MKKISLLILSSIICTAFTKVVLLTDYRDAYVGNYSCNSVCQGLNSDLTAITYKTNTITLNLSKDPLDSIMKVSIGKEIYKVKLVSSKLCSYPSGKTWAGSFYAGDSIWFVKSTSLSPNDCKYVGKKN